MEHILGNTVKANGVIMSSILSFRELLEELREVIVRKST